MKLIISNETATILKSSGYKIVGLRCNMIRFRDSPSIYFIIPERGAARSIVDVSSDEALVTALRYDHYIVPDNQIDDTIITIPISLYELTKLL